MRQYAYDIVYRTMEKNAHSDECFHRIIEKKDTLTAYEKSFLKRLSFGTIERAIEMDACIMAVSEKPVEKLDPQVRTILRMGLYEIRYMDQVPPAVTCHEMVNLARKKAGERTTGYVNAVLRGYIRSNIQKEPEKNWQRYSMPEKLMDHLCRQYGKKTTEKIARSFLEKNGEITIHLDVNKISPDEYKRKLDEKNVVYRDGEYWKETLILTHVPDIKKLPGYEEGLFFVQDESSMLPVVCAGINKGDIVADVCSAPGGKTVHALLELNGTGMLYAGDVNEYKVEKIRENIKRMRYQNACCKVWDATQTDPEMEEKADVLLADVPCSGIGIIGRKPEIKYHALEEAESLIPIQREICRSSVRMLKPGGVFIYSTCTINREENEDNVLWIEENCGLQRESLDPYLPSVLQNRMTAEGMLQMLPGLQKSDGFFVARLRKKEM